MHLLCYSPCAEDDLLRCIHDISFPVVEELYTLGSGPRFFGRNLVKHDSRHMRVQKNVEVWTILIRQPERLRAKAWCM